MSTDKAMVTDAMVEAACAAHWTQPWPGDRSDSILRIRRSDMRKALTAALAHPPAKREAGETAPAPVQDVVGDRQELIDWLEYRASCSSQEADDCNLAHVKKIRLEDAKKFRAIAELLNSPSPQTREHVSDTPSAALEASHE